MTGSEAAASSHPGLGARALRFTAPRTVEVAHVPLSSPREEQAVVRAEYSGISSGTEMLAWRGDIDPRTPVDETLGALSGTFAYPFSYGYSCVGVVEASGGSLTEGSRVFAFHPHQDRFVVDEADAVPMDDVAPRVATLYPAVETALQVCLDAGARYGEVVVVQGLGAVGVLTAAIAGRAGSTVLGVEPAPWRREAAGAFGVTAVDTEEAGPRVRGLSEGRGADLVIEASGDPAALSEALALLCHEGTVLVCSWYGTKPVPVPLGAAFHRRRLTIRSTQVSSIPGELSPRWDRSRRTRAARSLMGELPLDVLATHEFPFEEAARAYEAIDREEEGLIHAALRYG